HSRRTPAPPPSLSPTGGGSPPVFSGGELFSGEAIDFVFAVGEPLPTPRERDMNAHTPLHPLFALACEMLKGPHYLNETPAIDAATDEYLAERRQDRAD